MKNVFLIPTDKPTGIFESKISGLQYSIMPKIRTNPLVGFHLYITSDEKISGFENNIWVIKGDRIILWQNTMALVSSNKPKKIILTTDQDLIADGVQPIDDEFLEWFVKNPSCESVEVTQLCKIGCDKLILNGINSICCGDKDYKIIIPQEKPKQETLEEAAFHYSKNKINKNTSLLDFTKGAKWQAQKMYSEQDMQEYATFCIRCHEQGLPCIIAQDWFKLYKN